MKNQDIIRAYIHNTLSEKDRAAFNNRLENEEGLQQEFEEFANTYVQLQAQRRQEERAKTAEVKASMDTFLKKNPGFFPTPKISWIKRIQPIMAMAASILLLVSVGFGYWWTENNPSLGIPLLDIEKSQGYGSISQDEAVDAFDLFDYKKAVEIWEAREKSNVLFDDSDDQLRFAISLLKTSKYQDAIKQLEQLEDKSYYDYAILWYKCIAYYHLGDRTNAKIYFDQFQLVKEKDQKFLLKVNKDYEKLYRLFY